ncbi:unnamed protein product [Taenia asiatica]|uniref:Secreted protein n=1 Tax=Taenia asiatica TaxID=60517 RepID=A0A0R3WCL4_TAEAS|nr:unnamed protein product [Taenia asiatica]
MPWRLVQHFILAIRAVKATKRHEHASIPKSYRASALESHLLLASRKPRGAKIVAAKTRKLIFKDISPGLRCWRLNLSRVEEVSMLQVGVDRQKKV